MVTALVQQCNSALLKVSALAVILQPTSYAAGVVVVMATPLPVAAGVAFTKMAPASNTPYPRKTAHEVMQQQELKHNTGTESQEHHLCEQQCRLPCSAGDMVGFCEQQIG